MRYFQNRGIAARLWLGFGAVLLLLLAIAGFSLERMQRNQRQGAALLARTVGLLDAIGQAQDASAQRDLLLHDLVLNDSLKAQRATTGKLQANARQLAEATRRLERAADSAAIAAAPEALRVAKALAATLAQQESTVLEKVADARFDEAKTFLTETMTPQQQALQQGLRAFSKSVIAAGQADVEAGTALADRVALLVGALALAAVAVGAAVAFWTTRGVVRPLHAAREAALKVARGDLSQEIHSSGSDEIAQLVGALEWMRMALADSVADIRNAALGVHNGAQQIEQGNASLAARTEDQATSLEETASSMEELTATVQQNAASAGEANALAQSTSSVATRGGDAVRGVVATMQGIHQASSRIADISGVIDSIAFQTNILALNAAVEAARAGEQGRGFAVVAAEVRSLAQRSAIAAREIKGLIDESTARVAGGVREVETAGRTMDEIVASVQKVNALVAEIAQASAEQLAGIEQVNLAIAQMDGNTQQNTSIVEQAAGAAEHLAQQARVLVQAVAKFKLEEREGSGAETEPARESQAPGIAAPLPAFSAA